MNTSALLQACRQGNSKVFHREMKKAEEAMRRQLAKGESTAQQEAWVDRLGHQYNIFVASQFGIPEAQVAKTGYGSELLATLKQPAQTQTQTALSPQEQSVKLNTSSALEEARGELEDLDSKYARLKNALFSDTLASLPQTMEQLANVGASKTGGLARTEALHTASSLRQALATLDAAMLGEVAKAKKEMARLEQQGKLELAQLAQQKAEKELEALAKQQAALEERLWEEEKLAFEKEKFQATQALAERKEQNSYEKWLTQTAADREQSQKDEEHRLRQLTLSEQRLALDKWKAEQSNKTAAGEEKETQSGSLTRPNGTPYTSQEQAYLLFLQDTLKGLQAQTVLHPVTHEPMPKYTDSQLASFIMSMERFPEELRRQVLADAHMDVNRLLYGSPLTDFTHGMNPATPDFTLDMLKEYYSKEQN